MPAQAQESGEAYELQDRVLYALDGLGCSAGSLTQRESAATLAEICVTRRGRLALRSVGDFSKHQISRQSSSCTRLTS